MEVHRNANDFIIASPAQTIKVARLHGEEQKHAPSGSLSKQDAVARYEPSPRLIIYEKRGAHKGVRLGKDGVVCQAAEAQYYVV